MAQQLEPLNLRITGNANGLSAALGKSQQEIGGFAGRFRGLLGGLRTAGPAVALAASLAAVTAGATTAAVAIGKIKSQLDQIDEGAKAANKLAITFTELQGLRLSIGESAGLDNDSIDRSLQKFQLNLGEAARDGSGKVFEALSRVGLDAGELLRAGPVEALKQIADATGQIQNPTDQLLLAYELFGKQGVGIVTTLRAGREAIEDSFNFGAKWLGLTQEQTALVEAANDSWGRVAVIIEGVVQLVSAELAPAFLAITSYLTDSASGVDGIADGVRVLVDWLINAAGVAFDLFELSTATARTLLAIASLDFSSIPAILNDAFAFDSGPKFLDAVNEQRRLAAEAFNESSRNGLSASDQATIDGLDESTRALDENAKAIEAWKDKAESLRDQLATPEESYKKTIEELSLAVTEGGLEFEFFARGVAKAREELDRSRPSFGTRIKATIFGTPQDTLATEREEFLRKPGNRVSDNVQVEIATLKAKIEAKRTTTDQPDALVAAKLDQTNLKLDELRKAIIATRSTTQPVNL